MNFEEFEDWQKSVEDMNRLSSKIDNNRNEIYEWLANEIKQVFEENDLPTRNVNFSTDGSIIQVWLDIDTSDSIRFSKQFLKSIGMPFSVKRVLDSEVRNELFVELYPLECGG